MSKWICPECRGAFPKPAVIDMGDVFRKGCPWCNALLGDVE